MAGNGDPYEVEGNGHLSEPITRFHFNAFRDHHRREFRNSLDPIEEKQDKLSQDLQQLMGNVNERLTQNIEAMRADLVADIVRELRQGPEDASVHGAPRCGNVGAAGRGRGEGAAGRRRGEGAAGRGGGHRRANLHDEDTEEECEEDNYEQQRNGRFHRQGNYGRVRHEEERFGKLKFTMPKFDGGSDPETYLTWELKLTRFFACTTILKQRN